MFESDLISIKDRVSTSKEYTIAISEINSLVTKIEEQLTKETDPKIIAQWNDTLGELRHAQLHLGVTKPTHRADTFVVDAYQETRARRYLDYIAKI